MRTKTKISEFLKARKFRSSRISLLWRLLRRCNFFEFLSFWRWPVSQVCSHFLLLTHLSCSRVPAFLYSYSKIFLGPTHPIQASLSISRSLTQWHLTKFLLPRKPVYSLCGGVQCTMAKHGTFAWGLVWAEGQTRKGRRELSVPASLPHSGL